VTLVTVLALSAPFALPAHALGQADGGTTAPAPGAITLSVAPHALLGSTVRVAGQLGDGPTGEAVTVQRRDPRGAWHTLATVRAGTDGGFVARWRADQAGRVPLRALSADRAVAAGATPTGASLTVYRPALATWYGPGSYGSRTACGQRLTSQLVGVAHRTLPCGTRVEVYFRGRTVTMPVVDRGPYAHGADWDLTAAAARALHFDGVERIGAITLRRG
jgi:rare lipoprotein A (peptidoglycan hydrolase)